MVEKEDHYVQTFMGSTYDIGTPETIGKLKKVLEEIIKDLPLDNSLGISEIHLSERGIDYTLKKGIIQ